MAAEPVQDDSESQPLTGCSSHDVRGAAGAEACAAAGCHLITAAPVEDGPPTCHQPAVPVACLPDEPCDDALTLARSPDGQLFLFFDLCLPPGWTAVDGPTGDIAACTAARAGGAVESYRAALGAYNDGDQDAYFDAFAATLQCFHGTPQLTRADVQERRAPDFAGARHTYAAQVTVLREEADRVLLLDRGADFVELDEEQAARSRRPSERHAATPIRSGTHEKLVLMVRDGDRFRIAAETARNNPGCLADIPPVPASAEFARCATAARSCNQECDSFCSGDAPGNACNTCPESCASALARCTGAGPLSMLGG